MMNFNKEAASPSINDSINNGINKETNEKDVSIILPEK